jgi:hypothetical protein
VRPERIAAVVIGWARLYTRGLPAAVARRRIDEIAADLHDHIAYERERGVGEGRIALGILSRMVRGIAADATWRGARGRALTVPRAALRSLLRVALATGLVLLVPAVATLVLAGMTWTPFDFAVAAVLLCGAGLALELARTMRDLAYRAAVALAVVAALVLTWANLAVGVVGEPGAGVNALFAAVLGLGLTGAAMARLRPRGMARALLATALAQAVAAPAALVGGGALAGTEPVARILAANAVLVALFAASGLLFRRAARTRPAASAEVRGG